MKTSIKQQLAITPKKSKISIFFNTLYKKLLEIYKLLTKLIDDKDNKKDKTLIDLYQAVVDKILVITKLLNKKKKTPLDISEDTKYNITTFLKTFKENIIKLLVLTTSEINSKIIKLNNSNSNKSNKLSITNFKKNLLELYNFYNRQVTVVKDNIKYIYNNVSEIDKINHNSLSKLLLQRLNNYISNIYNLNLKTTVLTTTTSKVIEKYFNLPTNNSENKLKKQIDEVIENTKILIVDRFVKISLDKRLNNLNKLLATRKKSLLNNIQKPKTEQKIKNLKIKKKINLTGKFKNIISPSTESTKNIDPSTVTRMSMPFIKALYNAPEIINTNLILKETDKNTTEIYNFLLKVLLKLSVIPAVIPVTIPLKYTKKYNIDFSKLRRNSKQTFIQLILSGLGFGLPGIGGLSLIPFIPRFFKLLSRILKGTVKTVRAVSGGIIRSILKPIRRAMKKASEFILSRTRYKPLSNLSNMLSPRLTNITPAMVKENKALLDQLKKLQKKALKNGTDILRNALLELGLQLWKTFRNDSRFTKIFDNKNISPDDIAELKKSIINNFFSTYYKNGAERTIINSINELFMKILKIAQTENILETTKAIKNFEKMIEPGGIFEKNIRENVKKITNSLKEAISKQGLKGIQHLFNIKAAEGLRDLVQHKLNAIPIEIRKANPNLIKEFTGARNYVTNVLKTDKRMIEFNKLHSNLNTKIAEFNKLANATETTDILSNALSKSGVLDKTKIGKAAEINTEFINKFQEIQQDIAHLELSKRELLKNKKFLSSTDKELLDSLDKRIKDSINSINVRSVGKGLTNLISPSTKTQDLINIYKGIEKNKGIWKGIWKAIKNGSLKATTVLSGTRKSIRINRFRFNFWNIFRYSKGD